MLQVWVYVWNIIGWRCFGNIIRSWLRHFNSDTAQMIIICISSPQSPPLTLPLLSLLRCILVYHKELAYWFSSGCENRTKVNSNLSTWEEIKIVVDWMITIDLIFISAASSTTATTTSTALTIWWLCTTVFNTAMHSIMHWGLSSRCQRKATIKLK